MASPCSCHGGAGLPVRGPHHERQRDSPGNLQGGEKFHHVPPLRKVRLLEAVRHLRLQEGCLPVRPPRDRVLRSFHVFLG